MKEHEAIEAAGGLSARDERLYVNALRFLALDQVERAGSGHPGMPLGAAPMAYVLWNRFLRHNPRNPAWPDRDRFVLSAGHGSALLYALLHLSGYDLPLGELERFRREGSRTPGHPEYGETPGVEATTGPLGQGFAMGVGMALAERFLGECFNTEAHTVVDHHTYAICSDGDLMEGVSAEAASLAATLGLGKLVYLYDDNHISIEGGTDLAFTEDVCRRFEAYGWHVTPVEDGNDLDAIEEGIEEARAQTERPSLVVVRTRIGYGSPLEGTAEVHGAPLGAEALQDTKKRLGWPYEEPFRVPREVVDHFRRSVERGARRETEWKERFEAYREDEPELAARFERQRRDERPPDWEACLPGFEPEDGPIATRAASGEVLNALTGALPELIGGSADLAPSTKTTLIGYGDLGFDRACARNIHFGVREHAMGAVVNGMALHGGVLPYGATFLVFSDYLRPALRLSALQELGVTFVFTHDSIGLGEDGPTHQPIEHLLSLRAIPGFRVYRPADANETAAAWRAQVASGRPGAVALTRQALPVLDVDRVQIREGAARGGYVLRDPEGEPDVILLATGSEVHVALEAADRLGEEGVGARVVSLPCWELFREQSRAYREEVLPPEVDARVAVEAGSPLGWATFVGREGAVVGIDRFGQSAPGEVNMETFGFTAERVAERATALLERTTRNTMNAR